MRRVVAQVALNVVRTTDGMIKRRELPHISRTVDRNTERDDCDEEEFVDCNTEPTEPEDCNKEEFECPKMVLRPHATVVEQGPLISGRLDTQLIEGAQMLLYHSMEQ